jgi:predicted phosphoadenosine phosphosulfate sulfurtransferase
MGKRKSKLSVHLKKHVVDENVYDLAIERINHAYDLYDHIAVLFSGGKDSTVCVQLALEVARARNKLPLDVVTFDEEAIPYQTEDYMRIVANNPDVNFRWYCLPVLMINACSRLEPNWWCWDPDEKDKWCRPLPPEAITELKGFQIQPREKRLHLPELNGLLWDISKVGTVGVILGIRAMESMTRQRAVTKRAKDNYIVEYDDGGFSKGSIWKIYPIYDWTDHDVWTAPNKFEWDYNHAYDVMEAAGVPASQQRCSPAFGFEPIQKLWTYKTCFPEIWEKMIYRVAGANTAIRYATTEIYGYGRLPEKPSDMRWEEFIVHFVKKQSPENAPKVAYRLKEAIRQHHTKTLDPILYEAAHHESGLSWKFLLMLAMRGDPKNRKDFSSGVAKQGSEKYIKMKAKYEAALETYNSGGADGGSRF